MEKKLFRQIAKVAAVAFCTCALVALAGCGAAENGNGDGTVSFTDAAGRTVDIPSPDALEKVFYTSTQGEILVYSVCPELCAGTCDKFSDLDSQYLGGDLISLPNLGTQSGGKELNPEAIMAEGVQLIFSVAPMTPGEKDITEADDLQGQTGIPVVVLDGSIDKIAETYEILGGIVGHEKEAKELADYCTGIIDGVTSAVAGIDEADRVSMYYAEGPEGTQTEPDASNHALIFQMAGAKNVAADVEVTSGKGMSPVSMEQILAWNPEVIIAWDDVAYGGADEIIRTDANWANIQAVKDGKVYTMPSTPFSWCDRPQSVNRILGLEWVANTLYPDVYDVDMVQETKTFYDKFFHVQLTDEQIEFLLGNSLNK